MNFNELHDGISCDCTKKAFADFDSTYGMKTNKEHLREVDFKSHWEKGKRPESDNCKEICSFKAKSLSIINGETFDEVKKIYQQLFPISPGYKPYLAIIKFSDKTGLVEPTPILNVNPHHYDFYKCDEFIFENVEHIESHSLADNV